MYTYEQVMRSRREWRKPFPEPVPEVVLQDVPSKYEKWVYDISNYQGIKVEFNDEHRAYYNADNDYIAMPRYENYIVKQEWICTFCHELIHWTGHEKRLNRLGSWHSHSDEKAIEELTAELGSTMLCKMFEDKVYDNSKAYLKAWVTNGLSIEHYHQAFKQALNAFEYLLDGKLSMVAYDVKCKGCRYTIINEARDMLWALERDLREQGIDYIPYKCYSKWMQ